jgi:type III restriction enzyme
MTITLAQFQQETIENLMHFMEQQKIRDIVVKSCTGSGKTIILTHFIDEYLKSYDNTVFIWLTPGKGELEEQSKEKMDTYIPWSQTKLLEDVMTDGFEDKDVCFINWEKLNKKDNNALKFGEHTDFKEHIQNAKNNGLSFKVIIDESHHNDNLKADQIISFFDTDKIIRCSATPNIPEGSSLYEVDEDQVIEEGLIKKRIIINPDFPQKIIIDNKKKSEDDDAAIAYLIDEALKKQNEIIAEYKKLGKAINPLIIVQLPDNNEYRFEKVEEYLQSEKVNISYDNGLLAVHLSEKKINIENVKEIDAPQKVIIIKQAIATGWDCPRAHILVKLRDQGSDRFEIQTIGRIRRMPEAAHYGNEILDNCYLFTFDGNFSDEVSKVMARKKAGTKLLSLKPEHRKFWLQGEQIKSKSVRDIKLATAAIQAYYKSNNITNHKYNKMRLEEMGYRFNESIITTTISGEVRTIAGAKKEIDHANHIEIYTDVSTHNHGRLYHHIVADIGRKNNFSYEEMNKMFRRLFLDQNNLFEKEKLLTLSIPQLYSFVINNEEKLNNAIKQSRAEIFTELDLHQVSVIPTHFAIPEEEEFKTDEMSGFMADAKKNVYEGYLLNGQGRSKPEIKFESYLESSANVDWFYKNGDKGIQYFSLVYMDNTGYQKHFYPDYIVSVKGKTWIIETKGGFSNSGDSQDIDDFSAKKFLALKTYLSKHNDLKGGFVRYYENDDKLHIAIETYTSEYTKENWLKLDEVLK